MTDLEKLKAEMDAAEAAWIAADDDAAYAWIATTTPFGQPEDIAVALLAERDGYNAYEAARIAYDAALAAQAKEQDA